MRYSIYSGDPDGAFSIDPRTGQITTAGRLDHEQHRSVLLNVQARSGQPPTFGHSQVSSSVRPPPYTARSVRLGSSPPPAIGYRLQLTTAAPGKRQKTREVGSERGLVSLLFDFLSIQRALLGRRHKYLCLWNEFHDVTAE